MQVFTFWNSDIDNAPLVVQMGIESWQRACRNEGHTFHLLNETNCEDFESQLPDKVKIQLQTIRSYIHDKKSFHCWRTYSDALRLALLYHFGGVWADPTTICMKPISEWNKTAPHGIKFPRYEGRAFTLETWLIVAERNNEILNCWLVHLLEYFTLTPHLACLSGANNGLFAKLVRRIARTHPAFSSIWFSFFSRRIWRNTDYFIIYFSFEHIFRKRFPLIPAHYLHLPLDGGAYRILISSTWSEFKNHWAKDRILDLPVIKLSWKRDQHATDLSDLPAEHLFNVINRRLELVSD